jgi:hypothetical protein
MFLVNPNLLGNIQTANTILRLIPLSGTVYCTLRFLSATVYCQISFRICPHLVGKRIQDHWRRSHTLFYFAGVPQASNCG